LKGIGPKLHRATSDKDANFILMKVNML